jgi:hypothetical protein
MKVAMVMAAILSPYVQRRQSARTSRIAVALLKSLASGAQIIAEEAMGQGRSDGAF